MEDEVKCASRVAADITTTPALPVNEVVPSTLPLDESGRPLFRVSFSSALSSSRNKVNLDLNLRVVRPVAAIPSIKNQSYVFVGGSPGSGKTFLATRLQDEMDRGRAQSKQNAPAMVVIDTDELLQEVWMQTHALSDPAQQASYFLSRINGVLGDFFQRQPADALIICCGVSDYFTRSEGPVRSQVEYCVPHLPVDATCYFLSVPEPKLLAQRFRRDVIQQLQENAKLYLDPTLTPSMPEWSARGVSQEMQADVQVYVRTLGFRPLSQSDLLTTLTDRIRAQFALSRLSASSKT
jgi:hypothetical protein